MVCDNFKRVAESSSKNHTTLRENSLIAVSYFQLYPQGTTRVFLIVLVLFCNTSPLYLLLVSLKPSFKRKRKFIFM